MIAAHNALAAMSNTRRVVFWDMLPIETPEFRTASPYVLPGDVATIRTFDDPTIATASHFQMLDRFGGELREAQELDS